MRVLYLSHFGGLGGAERSLIELIVAVRGLGVEPILGAPSGSLLRAAAAAGIRVVGWHAHPLRRAGLAGSIPGLLSGWRELDRHMRSLRPRLVHANGAQALLWNGPVTWWRDCPLVCHWRDFYDSRLLAQVMARSSAALIAISEATLRFASGLLGEGRRLVLVRNGVADLPRGEDRRAEVRRSLGVPAQAPLLVMAGQSVPRKGHSVLLRALVLLLRQHPRVHARLFCAEFDAAARAHTQRLREEARVLGCGTSVRIEGASQRMAALLAAADVVAVPSLREPFGRLAVEAMLAERPVVASAVDGLGEIVTHGETGLLVPPGDPVRLAAALGQVLDDGSGWARRASLARVRALERFSISRVAEEVVTIYRAVA